MQYYEFAGLVFELDLDYESEFLTFERFMVERVSEPDIRISIKGCDFIKRPDGNPINDGGINYIHNQLEDKLNFFIEGLNTSEIFYMLTTNRDWSRILISYKIDAPYIDYFALVLLGCLPIRNRIILHKGLVIHSSAVEYKGRGIIFSAPSGTGKSTHASLWEKYLNASVLNDDSPALRIIDEKVYVYGNPWSGSAHKCKNDSVPLSAIVMLQQAPKNEIVRLKKEEAGIYLLPRVFLPYFDGQRMDMALKNLENIIEKTPVFLLKCTPEKDAMELALKCIS